MNDENQGLGGGTTVGGGRSLRGRLFLFDGVALGTAALLTSLVTDRDVSDALTIHSLMFVLGAVGFGIILARSQRLYQTSRSSIRSVELAAILRVGVMLGVSSVVLGQYTSTGADADRAVVLAVFAVALLIFSRSLFRAWLRARRCRGDFVRPVAVVGANSDAARIVNLLEDHRESGFSIVGMYSDLEDAHDAGLQRLWCGDVRDAADLVRDGKVTGAIIVASALDSGTLNQAVRDITASGGHVHIASGLHGFASQRIVPEPIAHEPLLHIHPTQLNPRQAVTKRVVDVVLSSVLLVLTVPVMLCAIVMIKLTDRGPGLFQQMRVGRGDRPFALLKLRTMAVDAEHRLDELACENVRSGPLFKVDNDPRVTRIGRILRATSIDELPQLWNVLRGDMSLVGPRPALPAEVEKFPALLSKRTNVPPGITGLWQVEARDNPSFDVYARLDLFYVDNWTLTFDFVIMLATVESEISRFLTAAFQRRNRRKAGADVLDLTTDAEKRRVRSARSDATIDLVPADHSGSIGLRSTFID